ncbi:MAG: tRNA pseudouridine(38-40) synthase TruA [Clostridia bacterium]|nr:tRNA pseudouridine(38-40) synthase TruA [Clostridia bacterium]
MNEEKNVLLTIAYDGTGFCGWQRQPVARTVCGELEKTLSQLCKIDVSLNGASRTDAGVHAMGQCATFSGVFGLPVHRMARAANDALAKDRLERAGEIQIVSATEKPKGFHARFDAKGKRYIYKIRNAEKTDVFCRNYFYQIREPLDVVAMKKAADFLVGEKDFRCFMASGSNEQNSTLREIYDCDLSVAEKEITISVSGSGFLYHMVRIIVGTLVEVGLGNRSISSMNETIASLDRRNAGHTAPPQGLYLQEVFYK